MFDVYARGSGWKQQLWGREQIAVVDSSLVPHAYRPASCRTNWELGRACSGQKSKLASLLVVLRESSDDPEEIISLKLKRQHAMSAHNLMIVSH
jgi:hypothetical protein